MKLAQETLTALQAKRAELSVGPSPSPRVGLHHHDEDGNNHALDDDDDNDEEKKTM